MLAALRKLPRPVSVFAVTDRLAEVALMAAESLGWRCPRDIRIVGVDDDEVLCASAPTDRGRRFSYGNVKFVRI